MFQNQTFKIPIIMLGGFLFVCLLVSFFSFSTVVSAEIPPRPELTPTPTMSAPSETAVPQPSQSAVIILAMPEPSPAYWTSVQWLDEHDEWQDVSGWQSDFNENGWVTWAVAAKDYGSGPYRWVVYLEEGGEVYTMTESFYLPESKQVVWLHVED